MIPMGLVLIQNIGIEIRKAQDLHQTPAKFMLCIAIINIIITIPMAKEYGAIGSAIGTSIAVVINQIFINFYYFLVCGLDIKLFLKQILIFSKGLIIPIIVGCLMISNKGKFNDITFLSMVIPYIIIYFISLYYFSFEKYEKDLFIGQPYNKISNIVNRYVKK
nr:polysaccharide biosynthesis C-terminal domain-containing protein [Holtiella tumoricola]